MWSPASQILNRAKHHLVLHGVGQRAMEQANLYGHPLQREVAFLTVHSMLHLLGYDHENGGLEAMRMREKEEAVLLQLGLPRTVSYTE